MKCYKCYIGIDPGLTGAMAVIGKQQYSVYDFEDGEALLKLQEISSMQLITPAAAVIEKVGTMPGQGVSSSGKFMANAGQWRGRLEALNIPFSYATPQKWQKLVFDSVERPHCMKSVNVYGKHPNTGKTVVTGKKKMQCIDWKLMSLELARRKFPGIRERIKFKKHHNRTDALLLADYCRQTDLSG